MPAPGPSQRQLTSDGAEWVSSVWGFEQGTWQPTIETYGGPGTGQAYSIRDGRWVRVARQLVHVTGRVRLSAKGTFPGYSIAIGNLPFGVTALQAGRFSAVTISYWNFAVAIVTCGLDPLPGTRCMVFTIHTTAQGGVYYTGPEHYHDTSDFIFGGHYFTSDP